MSRENLKINKKKTKTMSLNPLIKRASEDCGIETVTKFKYLGVTIFFQRLLCSKKRKWLATSAQWQCQKDLQKLNVNL